MQLNARPQRAVALVAWVRARRSAPQARGSPQAAAKTRARPTSSAAARSEAKPSGDRGKVWPALRAEGARQEDRMPTAWQRDLATDGPKFEAWLRRRLPQARDLRMSPLVQPQTSGFSNETLLFDAEWSEGGRPRREALVVRIQPIGYQVFPEYDLGLQFRSMSLLAKTDVPVPPVFWLESEDTSISARLST